MKWLALFTLVLCSLSPYADAQDTLRFDTLDTIVLNIDHGLVTIDQNSGNSELVVENIQERALVVNQENNRVKVVYTPDSWNFGNERFDVHVSTATVILVSGLDLNVRHKGCAKEFMSIKTSSGKIELDSIGAHSSVHLRTNTGDVIAHYLQGNIDCYTTEGSFAIESSDSGHIDHRQHGLRFTFSGRMREVFVDSKEISCGWIEGTLLLERGVTNPTATVEGTWIGKISLNDSELYLFNGNRARQHTNLSISNVAFEDSMLVELEGYGMHVTSYHSAVEHIRTSSKQEKRSIDDRFISFKTASETTAQVHILE